MSRRPSDGSGRRLLVLVALLTGCAGRPSAPVADRTTWESRPARGEHIVREGETLYSIAWRYGLAWEGLARRNGIHAPYTIYPGDHLRLASKASPASSSPAPEETGNIDVAANKTEPEMDRTGSQSSVAVARTAGAPPPAAEASAPAATDTLHSSEGSAVGPPQWSWPLTGEVVGEFAVDGGSLNKGVDILGASGAALKTAAAGEVVYAGSGLRGYGRLVIVKHGSEWLSAYAQHHALEVREGQRLNAGDPIAKLAGDSKRDRTVHFEVRHRGDPVDPAKILPSR